MSPEPPISAAKRETLHKMSMSSVEERKREKKTYNKKANVSDPKEINEYFLDFMEQECDIAFLFKTIKTTKEK